MKIEAKNAMLRIHTHSTDDEDTWILEGRLAGQVVDELTDAWRKTRAEHSGRKSVVDLVDLTSVDERGETALAEMMADGARFVVRGLYTRTLVESLRERAKQEA
jgi:ABC-type transporter Mla MlaB component